MKNHFNKLARVVVVAIATGALAACGKKDNAASRPELPAATIRTAVATAATTTRYQEVPGTVVAAESARLAPKVMGTVEHAPITLGQRVRKGDLLVKITAKEIEAKLEQARAGLDQNTRDLQRETALLAKGASTTQTVRDLEDRQRQMRAMVEEAETMLGYTQITAPFDGIVSRKLVNEGDLASPGQTLVEIEGGARLRIEAGVPESLASISVGASMPIRTDGGEFRGTLAELSSTSDSGSRTVPAKIDIPADAPVRRGEFVRVGIPAGEASPIVVPASAVSMNGQIERVFIVREGRALMRIVRTGGAHGDNVEIVSGLDAGELVATVGSGALRDGQRVEVLQ